MSTLSQRKTSGRRRVDNIEIPRTLRDRETNDNGGPVSPLSSSPPTPPSPLPISVGPGNQKYEFSASPTPSPPFSSKEKLPFLVLVHEGSGPVSFSVDGMNRDQGVGSSSSCLKDLLEWLMRRCCTCLHN